MKPTQIKPLDPLDVLAKLTLNIINHFYPIKDNPAARIKSVMDATGLKNQHGEAPTLIKTTTNESGETLIYNLPPGIIKKDFTDRREHFETYGSFMSEYYTNGTPQITIATYNETLPNMVPFSYTYEPVQGIAPVIFGKTPAGKVMISDLSTFPHLLLGGVTGYGKTSFLLGLTVSLKEAGCHVIAIDHKRLDFPMLSDYITVSLRESETLPILRTLIAEMERRLDLFSGKVQKFQDYKGPEKLPYIVLIVDELNTIEESEIQEAIHAIARLGRAPGISLVLATQKPSAKVWEGFTDTRDLCAARLSFYVSDYFMSQTILGKGNTRACSLPMIAGRGIVSIGDKESIIQSMYITADKALQHLEKLGKGEQLNHVKLDTIWSPAQTEHSLPVDEVGTHDNKTINDLVQGDQQRTKSTAGSKRNGKSKTTKKDQTKHRSKLHVLPTENR